MILDPRWSESPAACGGQVKTFCSPDFKAARSVWKRSIQDSPVTVWHKRLVETVGAAAWDAQAMVRLESHTTSVSPIDLGLQVETHIYNIA